MLKYFFLFIIFSSQSFAQIKWSFETEKNKSPLIGLDKKGSTNVTVKKKDGKLKLFTPHTSINDPSITKKNTKGLSNKNKLQKQIINEKNIVDKNTKKIEVIEKKIFESKVEYKNSKKQRDKIRLTKNKNISKADIVDTSFKKKALNFKNLMRETLSGQDAVFEAVKNIISEQKTKKVVEGDYLPYVDTEIEGEYHIFDNFREVPPLDEFDFNLESNWKVFDFGRKSMKYNSADLSINLARNNLDIVYNSELARLLKIYLDNAHQIRKLNLIEEYEKNTPYIRKRY